MPCYTQFSMVSKSRLAQASCEPIISGPEILILRIPTASSFSYIALSLAIASSELQNQQESPHAVQQSKNQPL